LKLNSKELFMKHVPEKIAVFILSGALLAGGVAVVSTVHASEQSTSKAIARCPPI
jgi:hypothetical protein